MVITCPKCKKQLKAPASMQGKKVQCNSCSHRFTVPVPAQPAKGKPAAPPKGTSPGKQGVDPDDSDGRPYDLTTVDLAVRCPHCAKELEEEGAVICIHCGYNLVTRTYTETKVTLEVTGMAQFLWLLPGILSLLLSLSAIGVMIWQLVDYVNWEPSEAEDDKLYNKFWQCFIIWLVVILIFVAYKAARFAFERLVLHPKRPEEVIKK